MKQVVKISVQKDYIKNIGKIQKTMIPLKYYEYHYMSSFVLSDCSGYESWPPYRN